MKFEKIDVTKANVNPFQRIGQDWMLISAKKEGKVNTMTASWGMMGVFWGKNVVTVGIRPQRFTTCSGPEPSARRCADFLPMPVPVRCRGPAAWSRRRKIFLTRQKRSMRLLCRRGASPASQPPKTPPPSPTPSNSSVLSRP